MEKKNYTKNGQCSNCGRCCDNLLFATKKEIDALKSYMKKNGIVLKSPYSVLDNEYKGVCPFLNESKKCSVYPARLKICRTFSCDEKLHEEMDYRDTEIIDMLDTFGEGVYYPCKPNIEGLNEQWKARLKKIYG